MHKYFKDGLQHKLAFIAWTTSNTDSVLREAKEIIDKIIIPAKPNHPSHNNNYRNVFSIPVKDGGLIILLREDQAKESQRLFGYMRR